MRVVIIGGAGFIGNNVRKQLEKYNHEVIIADRKETALYENHDRLGIKYECINFVTGEGLDKVIQENDIVIHLVSTTLPNMSNDNVMKDARENILASIQLLQICAEKKVAKVIYASSGGQIYGMPMYTPIDENHPTNPVSAYGIHKLAVEKYMQLFHKMYGMPIVVLRISNPYGPGQVPFRGQGVISTFIASTLLNKKIQIWGDGKSIRDYIYIEDVAEAFEAAIEYEGNQYVFNVGSSEGVSVNDILKVIESELGITASIEYTNEGSSDVEVNILSCEKAKRGLGWSPKVSIHSGIKQMIQCWNPKSQKFEL